MTKGINSWANTFIRTPQFYQEQLMSMATVPTSEPSNRSTPMSIFVTIRTRPNTTPSKTTRKKNSLASPIEPTAINSATDPTTAIGNATRDRKEDLTESVALGHFSAYIAWTSLAPRQGCYIIEKIENR